jgi:hypothetical protein
MNHDIKTTGLRTSYSSVYQTVVSGPPVARGGLQAVSKLKKVQKLYQKLKRKQSRYTPWRRLGGEEV